MAVASNFAGIAFAWARLGNVHAMSHPVSAYFNVPHGVANAILLPYILDYNQIADHDNRYEKIYNYIFESKGVHQFRKEMLAEEVRKLNTSLGIPSKLSDVGVVETKIPAMAEDAMKSGNIQANPRSLTIKDIIALYRTAL
jgi:alcohol dehydrogenase